MYELTIKFDSIEELRAYLSGITPDAQEELAPTQVKAERTRTAPKTEPEVEKPKATRKSKKPEPEPEPEQEEEDISYARLQAAVRKLIADGKSPKLKEILKQREWSSFKFLENEGSEDELRWAITKVEAELS
jgi:hypothetical protein